MRWVKLGASPTRYAKARLGAVRARAVISIALVLVTCLILGIWAGTARPLKIRYHLGNLDFWQRRAFGKSDRSDLLRWQAWSQAFGQRPSARREIELEYKALVSLGYMTNWCCPLSGPVTNSVDFTSLVQRTRAAHFSDDHWEFRCPSNRIEATIRVVDAPAWERLVRAWEVERTGRQVGVGNAATPDR